MKSSAGFADHLDQLIKLFRQLRAKHADNSIQGVDISLFKTVDLLLQNYDLIRNNVPREMLDQLGGPVQEMIVELINILKDELGDATGDDVVEDIMGEIGAIDELLREKNLAVSDIDDLLDERSRLMQKRNQQND